MRKLHRLILLAVSVLFGMAIGVIGPNPVALANAGAIEMHKSCVLYFVKRQEDVRYLSGNCSETIAISIVDTTGDLSVPKEGESRSRVSS